MSRHSSTRQIVERVLAPLLVATIVGCMDSGSGGCEPTPQATDAEFTNVYLQNRSVPCFKGPEAVRGSNAHLMVEVLCPGTSRPFLVGVSVDGEIQSLTEMEGAGHSRPVTVDAGPWEAADSAWHEVQVVIDPLNLFNESDEKNNRGSGQVRIIAPDASLYAANCGFVVPQEAGGDGFTQVTQVSAGTPVDVRLWLRYGGPYEAIVRSVRSLPTLDASDRVAAASCSDLDHSITTFLTRWTPPGPGVYDVEFKIEPVGTLPDLPTNNVVTKRLTVTATSPARTQTARVEERP